MSAEEIYVDSDNDVELVGLKDSRTGSYINDATVTYTLRVVDAENVGSEAVVSSLSDQEMTYQESSNGHYIGIIPDTATLSTGTQYWVDIVASASSDRDLRIRKLVTAKYAGTN